MMCLHDDSVVSEVKAQQIGVDPGPLVTKMSNIARTTLWMMDVALALAQSIRKGPQKGDMEVAEAFTKLARTSAAWNGKQLEMPKQKPG